MTAGFLVLLALVLVGADKESGSGNIMEALLAMPLSDRFAVLANNGNGHRSEEGKRLCNQTYESMKGKKSRSNG